MVKLSVGLADYASIILSKIGASEHQELSVMCTYAKKVVFLASMFEKNGYIEKKNGLNKRKNR